MLLYFAVKLTKLVVHSIDRLEWDQLDRVGGEIGSVVLVFCLGSAVFDFVRGALEFHSDPPGTGERYVSLLTRPQLASERTAQQANTMLPMENSFGSGKRTLTNSRCQACCSLTKRLAMSQRAERREARSRE